MIPFSRELGFLTQKKFLQFDEFEKGLQYMSVTSLANTYLTQFIYGRTGKSYLGYKLILDNQKQIEKIILGCFHGVTTFSI